MYFIHGGFVLFSFNGLYPYMLWAVGPLIVTNDVVKFVKMRT